MGVLFLCQAAAVSDLEIRRADGQLFCGSESAVEDSRSAGEDNGRIVCTPSY